jgi:uncharacterized protein YecT (DUF1311 family)
MKVIDIAALLAGVAFSLATPAAADETYDQCVAAQAADHNQCGDAWLAREQAGLDAKWSAVVAQTEGKITEALLAEQAAWTAFKDTSCAFMQDQTFAPGGDRTSFYACRAGVIAERNKAVDGYASYIDN